MTEHVLKAKRWAMEWAGLKQMAHPARLALILALLSLLLSSELRPIVLGAIKDAYLAVTVFVAGTLLIFYLLEQSLGVDLGQKMGKAGLWQAPIASFLGALPGCGGAIIVVTQYTKGLISFGSVVAVLIATMGDAAFLLLARDPLTGAGVLATGFVVGTLSGWLVDTLHGKDFMRAPRREWQSPETATEGQTNVPSPRAEFKKQLRRLWFLWLIPSIVIGLALAFQIDVDGFITLNSIEEPTLWIGALGGILCLTLWAFSNPDKGHVGQETADIEGRKNLFQRVVDDTNFVTTWVVVGFLTYELAVHFTGSSIEGWLQAWAPIVPLIAIAIGFIPGCGPQIIVTTLYLNGVIPLAALYGNAIANDGDALFPALALAPRAAIYATLYSAVPALIIAYLIYFTV